MVCSVQISAGDMVTASASQILSVRAIMSILNILALLSDCTARSGDDIEEQRRRRCIYCEYAKELLCQ
jgi:hypothetical protein